MVVVCQFKYLGSVRNDEDSKLEMQSRIARTTAALTTLKAVWNDRSISLSSNIRLMRSLVTSVFLHTGESWTLTAELQRRIQVMEMRCYRKILRIRPCYQRGRPCQDPAGNRTTRRPPDHGKELQTAVVWPCLPFIRSGQNHLARHNERGKKTRQSEEEVGRQQTSGNGQARRSPSPRGQWRKGRMEETGCGIIRDDPTTSRLRDR